MKKVLVLAIALGLFAAPAMAVIKGSMHDLSTNNTATVEGNMDRICAYCHTPHSAAKTALAPAPLWNRDTANITGANQLYNTSVTLTATSKAVTLANVNATDAPLCMSCHDGAIGFTPVNEVKGYSGAVTQGGAFTLGLLNDGANGLSNDHPIGMNYSDAASETDSGLNTLSAASQDGVKFYTTNADMMWCSSCHNVHEPGSTGLNTAPFLKTSNASSALCLACHAK